MYYLKKLSVFHYNIGFFDFESQILNGNVPNIHWMRHSYKDRFFADPFILETTNDEIKVLVEEFLYKDWKGRISLLIVDRYTYELKTIKVLLDLKTHLSFPFIFREKGVVYVIPENSASGSLSAYRYINETLKKEATVINVPLVDAIIYKHDKEYFLIGGICGRNENSDLFIWKSNAPLSDYQERNNNFPILKNNLSCARRGGDFFAINGKLYSAVQCCKNSYGESLNICEVNRISDIVIEEKIISTLYPDKLYKFGLHTFNQYNGLCVVDGLTYLFRPLYKMKYMRKLKK